MKKIMMLAGFAFALQSIPAQAECLGKQGYLYVTASCFQEDAGHAPENICQIRNGERGQSILFYSNVIVDNGSNNRFPTTQFFDKLQIQQNVTLNGDDSFCYDTRAEAEDALDELLSDWKRNGSKLVQVHMRDS